VHLREPAHAHQQPAASSDETMLVRESIFLTWCMGAIEEWPAMGKHVQRTAGIVVQAI
jgi:hypothetical protein